MSSTDGAMGGGRGEGRRGGNRECRPGIGMPTWNWNALHAEGSLKVEEFMESTCSHSPQSPGCQVRVPLTLERQTDRCRWGQGGTGFLFNKSTSLSGAPVLPAPVQPAPGPSLFSLLQRPASCPLPPPPPPACSLLILHASNAPAQVFSRRVLLD